jgi:hypothetical protein
MEELRENRERPRNRRRSTWTTFSSSFSDRIFRRMFRMSRVSFEELCRLIEANVGEEVFKSESYLANRAGTAVDAATQAVGGFISGEMKVAMTIRLLAGGSYLDILASYATGETAVSSISKQNRSKKSFIVGFSPPATFNPSWLLTPKAFKALFMTWCPQLASSSS